MSPARRPRSGAWAAGPPMPVRRPQERPRSTAATSSRPWTWCSPKPCSGRWRRRARDPGRAARPSPEPAAAWPSTVGNPLARWAVVSGPRARGTSRAARDRGRDARVRGRDARDRGPRVRPTAANRARPGRAVRSTEAAMRPASRPTRPVRSRGRPPGPSPLPNARRRNRDALREHPDARPVAYPRRVAVQTRDIVSAEGSRRTRWRPARRCARARPARPGPGAVRRPRAADGRARRPGQGPTRPGARPWTGAPRSR